MYQPDPSPILLTALAKAAAKLAKDCDVDVGQHPIAQTVSLRLDGVLSRAADTEQAGGVKIDYPRLVAECLAETGTGREACRNAITTALKRQLHLDEDLDYVETQLLRDRIGDAQAAIDAASAQAAATLPPRSRAGATTWAGVVSIVGDDLAADPAPTEPEASAKPKPKPRKRAAAKK